MGDRLLAPWLEALCRMATAGACCCGPVALRKLVERDAHSVEVAPQRRRGSTVGEVLVDEAARVPEPGLEAHHPQPPATAQAARHRQQAITLGEIWIVG